MALNKPPIFRRLNDDAKSIMIEVDYNVKHTSTTIPKKNLITDAEMYQRAREKAENVQDEK